eukprot:c863_g1_i1 orf=76-672(+)
MVCWRPARLNPTFCLLFNRPPYSCLPRWVVVCAKIMLHNEDLVQQKQFLYIPLHNRPFGSHTEVPDCPYQSHIPQVSVDSYVSFLQWCISSNSLIDGMCIHTLVITHSLEHHQLLGRRLLHMYVACGAMLHAQSLLTHSVHQSICSWNIVIKGYVKQGWRKEAFYMFSGIEKAGLQPDLSTFITVISAYAKAEDLDEG